MSTDSVKITNEEYQQLKKKAEIADDLIMQLESSLKDLKSGKIKKA